MRRVIIPLFLMVVEQNNIKRPAKYLLLACVFLKGMNYNCSFKRVKKSLYLTRQMALPVTTMTIMGLV